MDFLKKLVGEKKRGLEPAVEDAGGKKKWKSKGDVRKDAEAEIETQQLLRQEQKAIADLKVSFVQPLYMIHQPHLYVSSKERESNEILTIAPVLSELPEEVFLPQLPVACVSFALTTGSYRLIPQVPVERLENQLSKQECFNRSCNQPMNLPIAYQIYDPGYARLVNQLHFLLKQSRSISAPSTHTND